MSARRVPTWPVWVLAAPAAVSIWAGWVGLGRLTGFGVVALLPGIWDGLRINTAITLPVGMEAYAGYALYVWLASDAPRRAREFARVSAVAALLLGALGQIAYHLMVAGGVTAAPWPITAAVSCLPVVVLGMAAALAHLVCDPTRDVAEAHTTTQSTDLTSAVPDPDADRDVAGARELCGCLTEGACGHDPGRDRPLVVALPADRQPPADLSGIKPPVDPVGDPPEPSPGGPALLGRVDPVGSDGSTGLRPARPKTDAQLSVQLRRMVGRNGGAMPTTYQVRRALGVGAGRAQRLLAELGETTPTATPRREGRS